MFALPPPGTTASSSIWERRKMTKSTATDAEVEHNLLSLLLDSSIDDRDAAAQYSPWSNVPHTADDYRACSSASASSWGSVEVPTIQRSRSLDQTQFGTLEMHTAQLAVKAALDVLDEPSPATLRIATNSLGLQAPLSPALSSPRSPGSPISPADSCFSESGEVKKKGRARMSQEKRKRLARRREREALIAAISEQPMARSAPVTPTGYFHGSWGDNVFSTPLSSPRSMVDLPPSPALTYASGRTSSATPDSSPVNMLMSMRSSGDMASSPPTLVVQPPSPQRVRSARWNQTWSAQSNYASVY